ncbi:8288_t:CDS:2, partial [Racocetra persica]
LMENYRHSRPGITFTSIKMLIKMAKLGFLSVLIIFFLYVIGSFAAVYPRQIPRFIGNQELPDVEIPRRLRVPRGNFFKFHLFASGYLCYRCTERRRWKLDDVRVIFFNHRRDVLRYPFSGVASTYEVQDGPIGFRSIIPQDTSSLEFSLIAVVPSHNPTRNAPLQLSFVNASAFSDITYIIRAANNGGAPPANYL